MKIKQMMMAAALTLLVSQQAKARWGNDYLHDLGVKLTYSTYGDSDEGGGDGYYFYYRDKVTYRIGTKEILQMLVDDEALPVSSIKGLSIATMITYGEGPEINEIEYSTFVVDKNNNIVANISDYLSLYILNYADNDDSIDASDYISREGKGSFSKYSTTEKCQVELVFYDLFVSNMQGVLDLSSFYTSSDRTRESIEGTKGGSIESLSGEAYDYWDWYYDEDYYFEGILAGSIEIGRSEETSGRD